MRDMKTTKLVETTVYLDDITGQEVKQSKLEPYDVTVRFDDGVVEGTLELTRETADALADLLKGDGTKWRKLFEVEQPGQTRENGTAAPKRASKPKGDGPHWHTRTREWVVNDPEGQKAATDAGYIAADFGDVDKKGRGQMPKVLVEKFQRTHGLAA